MSGMAGSNSDYISSLLKNNGQGLQSFGGDGSYIDSLVNETSSTDAKTSSRITKEASLAPNDMLAMASFFKPDAPQQAQVVTQPQVNLNAPKTKAYDAQDLGNIDKMRALAATIYGRGGRSTTI